MAITHPATVSSATALMFVLALASACETSPPSRALADHSDTDRQGSMQVRAGAARTVIEAPEIPHAISTATTPLVILDVRPEGPYAAGHLPGAVRLDHRTWESDSLSEESGLDNESLWMQRIGELGIDGQGTVLIYDGGGMTDAARVWFILQGFGAADVRVINGGFPRIEDAVRGGAVTLSTSTSVPGPTTFVPGSAAKDRIAWISRQDLKALVDAHRIQILDARTAKEFEGTDLRGNSRGGHLPGAANLPHSALLDTQGRLKSPEEISRILGSAGFVKGEPIVTHCQGGGRAALAALAAARAGYGPVTNYYLSFGDWSADQTCPIVTP
jgi:thiosulfate/3-mercaptopyruvate sulfurtransferase